MSLSEKRRMEDDHSLMLRERVRNDSGYGNTEEDFDKKADDNLFISVEDVKEFIKELKNKGHHYNCTGCIHLMQLIDKLAGEALI